MSKRMKLLVSILVLVTIVGGEKLSAGQTDYYCMNTVDHINSATRHERHCYTVVCDGGDGILIKMFQNTWSHTQPQEYFVDTQEAADWSNHYSCTN